MSFNFQRGKGRVYMELIVVSKYMYKEGKIA